MMLSISTSKFLVAETSSGDYNFHRWTCKLSDDYSLNSKQTCKPPELHTIMKKCNGTGLVLKICETKNNVWKRYELSIQNGIDGLWDFFMNYLILMVTQKKMKWNLLWACK